MLHVVLWKWSQPGFRCAYTYTHVNTMSVMVREALRDIMGVKVHCVTDDAHYIDHPTVTFPLWKDHDNLPNATGKHLPSCYRRLKLFDRKTQAEMGIAVGDRIISLDLDAVILGSLADLILFLNDKQPLFAGWGVRGTYHETVLNGSFWSFIAGDQLQFMWDNFDPLLSPQETMRRGFLGSDQSWLSMNLAKHPQTCFIRFPMFASYPREVKRQNRLDKNTRIVFFHGSRKPWDRHERQLQPWIKRYWRIPHESRPHQGERSPAVGQG